MTRALPIVLAGPAALSLVACVPTGSGEQPATGGTPPPPEATADECEAGRLGPYLNLLPTSDAMANIREAVGHDRIRTINPGDAVTMDYRPDRLNLEIGKDGRIKLFRCG